MEGTLEIKESEINFLCEKLGLGRDELFDIAFAFRTHIEPKMAAVNVVDYMGSMMINQTTEKQNKTLLHVIERCIAMLLEG